MRLKHASRSLDQSEPEGRITIEDSFMESIFDDHRWDVLRDSVRRLRAARLHDGVDPTIEVRVYFTFEVGNIARF